MPDTCDRCPENGGQPSRPVVSSTHGNPTTSSCNPPGEGHASRTPRPTCSRERGGATPAPVLPPHPPLPRAGSTRGRAKCPAKYADPAAGPITTRMLTNHRPGYYRPGRASGDKCTAGTSAHLRRGVGRLGRVRLRHVYHVRMVRGAHPPQTVNSVHEREGGCNTTRYSCPPQPYPGHAGGHKLTTRGRADPPANRHGCVTPSPTRHLGRSVPTPQHKPNHPNHPSHHTRHRDTDTPPE